MLRYLAQTLFMYVRVIRLYVNHLHLHFSSWKLAGINDKPNWLYSKTIKRLLEALTHAFCQFSCSNAAKAAADFESKVERPLRRLSCLPKRRSPWPTARHGNSIGAIVKSLQWWPHSCILKIPVLDVWAQLGRFLRHLDTKCDETCNNDYYDDGSDSSSFCLCIFTYLVWACWDTCQWTWPWTLVHTFLVLCIMSKIIALLELLLTICMHLQMYLTLGQELPEAKKSCLYIMMQHTIASLSKTNSHTIT